MINWKIYKEVVRKLLYSIFFFNPIVSIICQSRLVIWWLRYLLIYDRTVGLLIILLPSVTILCLILFFTLLYFYLSDLIIAVWARIIKFLGTLSTNFQISRDKAIPTNVYTIHIQLFVAFNTGNCAK